MTNLLTKQQLRDFLYPRTTAHDLAVTLTMKQQDGSATLDRMAASKNMRHFLSRLNRQAFGNAASRHNKRISVVPILETSISGRLHYHLSMQNPFATLNDCGSAIEESWFKTRWGYGRTDVQPVLDTGWINYITKARHTDGWDIENTFLDG